MNIEFQKLKYGQQPILSFYYEFSTDTIYLPDYEDLYLGQRETEFERISAQPENFTNSLTHEFLHKWINENFDKNTSLALDNVDKNELNGTYSLLGKKVYKSV